MLNFYRVYHESCDPTDDSYGATRTMIMAKSQEDAYKKAKELGIEQIERIEYIRKIH